MSKFSEKRKSEKEKAEKKQFWKRLVTGVSAAAVAAVSIIMLRKK